MTINTDVYRTNLLKYTGIAFSLLPKIDKPAILDAGCGTGVPTIYLAQISGGTVTGVDTDSEALEKLKNKIRKLKLTRRINTVNSPIEMISSPKNKFDIVWAEGSIEGIRFSNAIKILGAYTRKGGFIVIHDDAADYMNKIKTVELARYKLYAFFFLGSNIWWNEYYRHIENKLKYFAPSHLPPELKCHRRDVQQFKRNPGRFVSAFFLMRKDFE